MFRFRLETQNLTLLSAFLLRGWKVGLDLDLCLELFMSHVAFRFKTLVAAVVGSSSA